MPFVSLFGGKRLHVAVLSDEAQGAKRKVERIPEVRHPAGRTLLYRSRFH